MKKYYVVFALIWFITIQIITAQTTPFTANWNFEGSGNGASSSGLVAASSVDYSGVNPLAVNPYTSGYVNLGVNVQNWSTSVCNQTEYVQISVQPLGTATITLTALSFAFARSAQGPQQLTVRSSVDGFSSDIFSQAVTTNYQVASIALSSSEFTNQSGSITFRIYACNPTAGGGTLKLDEIQINATVLPVTLLSFTAKPEGDRVQLAWATSTERDTDHFIVERSADLNEYVLVDKVAAKGTTNERQYYGLTDLNPQTGANYYRLKQIDFNGTIHSYKAISTIIRANEPVIAVYPNPASSDRIHLRLWNADDATVRLLATNGQLMDGRLERKSGEADFVFAQPLPIGLYWLEVKTNGQKHSTQVLVR
ncbi:T9SS type A sorting domain-containing protein [Spirosoma flavum]|uniref:T9SS type A sorting domain-containing protein n=1 Tax=Spirosoma flavum TaxID=2048557 RepID=A0ABW6AKJ7_9BACT